MSKIFFSIFIFFFIQATSAQLLNSNNVKFKNYTTLQGLANNSILKTVKDKHGFLWIATLNGISRFDGLKYKNYTHNPADSNSLRSIWISDLLIDEQQTLWASTEGGLCYYEPSKDRFVYINDKASILLIFKMPLCNGNNNTIWIAAEDGLKKVNCLTKKYEHTSLNRIADPQFIVQDNMGNLIIGTRGKGLLKYNIATNTYKLLSQKNIPMDTHYMGAYCYKGNLWIAMEEGLMLLNKDESFMLFSSGAGILKGNIIKQLMCVSPFEAGCGENYLVCGTYDKKLFLFDIKQKTFTQKWSSNATNPEGFISSIVFSIYEDKHILWIGTDRGLNQLNLKSQQQQSFYIAPLLSNENLPLVKKVIAHGPMENTKIWLIPWQPYYGVILYNRESQQILREWYTTKTGNLKKYNDIIRSRFGDDIIAVRDSALDFFNEKKGHFKTLKLPDNTHCIQEDDIGNLWIGADNGLILVNKQTEKIAVFQSNFIGSDLEKNAFGGMFPVLSLKLSTNNNIWLAVGKYGLFSFDIVSHTFTAHRQKVNSSFSTLNRCSSIEIMNNDSIWVGNMSGLSCYVPSQNKFINYDAADGLKSTYIYSIAKDKEKNIWGRGNADVFCFNTATKKLINTRLNPESEVFSYLQNISISDNTILLGHEAGFTVLNFADSLNSNITKPLLKIIDYKYKDKVVFLDNDGTSDPVKFKYYENQIGIDFAAIEFDNPDEIEFWYKLEGLEKEYINAGDNRVVTYNNLPHGKYRFAVFVLNRHNNMKSDIAFFSFTIAPAIWQRWWFWPLLAVIFIIVVVCIARKRITGIRQKEKQKTAINKSMAELETKMLRSQMNPHFIFNSLNSIQKYIWENKEEDAAEYLARFAKLMRAILENSRKELVLLKDEIEVMKLYIELEHRRSNSNFDYSIKLNEHIDLHKIAIPPLLMQPFIENAIWHGLNKKKEKGNLKVYVTCNDEQLICTIDDDGVGRQVNVGETSTEKKSLGIGITEQRINRLMETTKQFASVTIEDKKENGMASGTRVTLTLPLQNLEDAV